MRLKKNPLYWDAANTQSEIIDILPIGSPGAALNLYLNGQADIVWDKGLMPPQLLDVLLKRPDFHTFNYLGTYFIRFNVTKKPFDDPRVRRALALAIDKKRIVEKITKGGETHRLAFCSRRHGQLHFARRAGLQSRSGETITGRGRLSRRQGFPAIRIHVQRGGGRRR